MAYSSTTGEGCTPAQHDSRDYVVVESFVNQAHTTAVLDTATIDEPAHVHVQAGPWSYPGEDAGIRIVPYPLPTDSRFAPVRAAWAQRQPLKAQTLAPGDVVYVALVLRRDHNASVGTIKDIRLHYRIGSDQYENAGAYSYRMQVKDCT